jgi:uncharacterized protein YndB with AHSA1/START domain
MTTMPHLAGFVGGTTREITTAGGRHGLHMTREYATAVEDLWAAWTDPERLSRWLGRPDGDLREGGELRLWMGGPTDVALPEGVTEDVAHVSILHCAEPERLTVRWAWGSEAPSVVEIRLAALAADRSRLELEHLVLDRESATGYGAGWEDFLARLDAAVTGRPTDFPSIEPAVTGAWMSAAEAATPLTLPLVESMGNNISRLEVDRHIAAPPDRVWSGLTTKSGLEGWYVNDVTGDLSPGGRFRCVFDQGEATGEVLSCTPEREVVVTWEWAHAPAEVSRMTVTLRPEGSGTHVRWRQDDATGNVAAYAAGLQAHLVGLDRATRGLTSSESRWYADFVITLSNLHGGYSNPFG